MLFLYKVDLIIISLNVTHGLLFQWTSAIKLQLPVLVLYKVDLIIISLNVTHGLLFQWTSAI